MEIKLPRVPEKLTIREAQSLLRDSARNGGDCPCCGQRYQLHRRKLNSGMAATLVWLVQYYAKHRDWVHVQEIAPRHVVRSNEIGKLVHWDLVQLRPKQPDQKSKTSGMWKPKRDGVEFALDHIEVSKYVYLYNNEIVGFSDEMISIAAALGDHFDYDELMRGEWDTDEGGEQLVPWLELITNVERAGRED
jgi:hypothetical protein